LISARFGVAVSLVLAVAALAIGIAAFMATVRDKNDITGRIVQSRTTNEYDGPPLSFPLDDFFIGRGSDGRQHAFYAYPPGYFGHVRGCRMIWDPAATVQTQAGAAGPGLYVDPCGGARFSRDGELVAGPADRNLDYFATSAGVEGVLVDTKRLYCGSVLPSDATPESGDETPANTPEPETETCDRVSPNTRRP